MPINHPRMLNLIYEIKYMFLHRSLINSWTYLRSAVDGVNVVHQSATKLSLWHNKVNINLYTLQKQVLESLVYQQQQHIVHTVFIREFTQSHRLILAILCLFSSHQSSMFRFRWCKFSAIKNSASRLKASCCQFIIMWIWFLSEFVFGTKLISSIKAKNMLCQFIL